jgi:hypothetical protein
MSDFTILTSDNPSYSVGYLGAFALDMRKNNTLTMLIVSHRNPALQFSDAWESWDPQV